jgi:type III restriction enzyme
MAQALEELGEEGVLISYVKNQQLGFYIPYTVGGEEHNYIPDFIAKVDDGRGKEDPLNLIVEVSGERDKDKEAKVSTARNLWVPGINNHGGFGRWGFIEISDPWDAKNTIRAVIEKTRKA